MTWRLLSETRKQCILAALIGTALAVTLVFVQSVSGLLEGITALGWLWVMMVVLPALVVLWISILRNRYPAKIVHPTAHQTLVWGSWTYFLLALLTLLAEPLATRGSRSLQQYLTQSLWWTLPLELMLIAGYWLIFYRKDSIFKADEKIILDFAAQKAATWEAKGNLLRQQCFELIASNDMPGAFSKMKAVFEKAGSAELNAIVLLEGQYNSLLRDRDLNVVDRDKSQIELNRIVMGVLNLGEKV